MEKGLPEGRKEGIAPGGAMKAGEGLVCKPFIRETFVGGTSVPTLGNNQKTNHVLGGGVRSSGNF